MRDSTRLSRIAVLVVVAGLGWLLSADFPESMLADDGGSQEPAVEAVSDDEGSKQPEFADDLATTPQPCLKEPLHFSYLPSTMPGTTVVWSPFVRFETPAGDTINARIYVLKVSPGGAVPDRVVAFGQEIKAGVNFTPDLEVRARYVKKQSECQYVLNLGNLECPVRTTRH